MFNFRYHGNKGHRGKNVNNNNSITRPQKSTGQDTFSSITAVYPCAPWTTRHIYAPADRWCCYQAHLPETQL